MNETPITDHDRIMNADKEFGESRANEILEIADDLMSQFCLILDEEPATKGLSPQEYGYLIALIRDGFSDDAGIHEPTQKKD